MRISCTNVVVIAAAVLATSANAHSKMSLPKPTWIYEDGPNGPAGTVDSSNVLPTPAGMGYLGDPLSNAKAYWTAFNASKYTSLKELVWENEVVNTDALYGTATIECGFSWINGTARDLPDEVKWDKLTTGHDGPCEIWCDDTLVFSDQNCAVNYPDSPASFPYNKAACEGKSMLTTIWLAVHSPPWQVFTNCAPLTGATSKTSSSTAPATKKVPTATIAPITEAPEPPTASSQETSIAADYDTESASSEEASGDAATTETEEPVATTDKLVTTSSPTTTVAAKCSRRRT